MKKQQSSSEYIAFAVVASVSLTAALLIGRGIDLSVYAISQDRAHSLPLERTGAPVRPNVQQQQQQQQSQPRYPPAALARQRAIAADVAEAAEALQQYHRLHNQPVLAVHHEAGSYPEIHWPQHSGELPQLPSDAVLQASGSSSSSSSSSNSSSNSSSSSHANGPNPFMLVAYNGTFFGQQWPTHALQCAVPCIMTSDTAKYDQRADVLVYHAPELDWDSFWAAPKPQHQLWALHSMESEEAYTVQQAAAPTWQRFDIQANYKLSAVRPELIHVAVPYLNSAQYGGFREVRPAMFNKTGLALWMHNNCDAVSYRQQLVQQLMQLMPVDSPGACLNNMDAGGLNTAAPTELMARYKFYLVFENVFGDPDWVSSTFFRALDAGAVPVVLGAPNVLKFAPGQRSIIRACDFDSAQDLADYLLYLDSNDTAYREYLSWKEAGPSAAFSSLMRTADLSPWCEVCIAAAQRNPRAFDAATQQTLLSHQQTKRAFDQLNARLDQEASIACRGKTAWWEVQPAEGDAALWARDEAVGAPARRMTS